MAREVKAKMGKDEVNSVTGEDRRRFFRIDDAIHLSIRRISPDDLPADLEQLNHDVTASFTLMSSLAAVGQQTSASLRRIEQSDPDVAECIKGLERRLDMIAKALLSQDSGLAEQPALPVNLSAGGVAIHYSEAIPEDAMVEIKMLLLPSHTGILTYGQVINCEETAEYPQFPYRLRITFSHIRDVDRDALIRHVLRRQGESLRKRRQDQEK